MNQETPREDIERAIYEPISRPIFFLHGFFTTRPDVGRPHHATYFVLLASEPFLVAPRNFVHRVRIPEIGGGLVVAPRRDRVLLHPPPVSEGIGQFIHGQYQLPFGSAPFLHPCRERS